MRIDRLMPCMLLAFVGCGDNNAAPDARQQPKFDGPTTDGDGPTTDATGGDGPEGDGPQAGTDNITDLTPVAGQVLRADFVTPLFFKPDGTEVAVAANFVSGNARMEPIVVPLDGSGLRRLVNVSTCGTCDVDRMAWSADGGILYALGDLSTNAENEVALLAPTLTDQTVATAADVTGTNNDVQNLFVVDAGGGNSRVWVVGNWLSASREAGAFLSNKALPFDVSTPPPIVLPGGGAELFSGTGSTVNIFHASAGKIAFVSDLTQNNRFDLYIANADGSSPTILVTGSANIEISGVRISPDGTKVAYLMDSLLVDNGVDLHVIPAAGGASKQLSPTRLVGSGAQDVFFEFEWSADSKFIGFSADLETDGVDSGYVVDTTQVVPVATVVLPATEVLADAGAKGIRGKLLFDENNSVYFRAHVTAGDTRFKLFKVTTGGTKTTIDLPPRTDTMAPDVGAFGITPDGTKIVFSADSPDVQTYNLFVQTL